MNDFLVRGRVVLGLCGTPVEELHEDDPAGPGAFEHLVVLTKHEPLAAYGRNVASTCHPWPRRTAGEIGTTPPLVHRWRNGEQTDESSRPVIDGAAGVRQPE